jgi:hypothetical protein
MQLSSTFTTRLNEDEIPIFNSLSTSNTQYFLFNINNFPQELTTTTSDPNYLHYTYFGNTPIFFTDSIRIMTRQSYY